jgi:hypothetical protein
MTLRKEVHYIWVVVSFALMLLAVLDAKAEDQWVTSIQSSNEWAVFPCTDYIIANVCGTDKDYSDPGTLPPVISVGDTISYQDKDGKSKQFVVRHIQYYVYDKDVDFKYAGKRLTAKKGDTSCYLFDVRSRASTRSSEYPSKVVIKNCRVLR